MAQRYYYYLVDAGMNPAGNRWFTFIKGIDESDAQEQADLKGLGRVKLRLSSNFRESIGRLIFDLGYPTSAIKPIAEKYPEI